MYELVFFNLIALFGIYTGLRFRMRSKVSKSAEHQNLKAMNLIFKNYHARNSKLPLNQKIDMLKEFEAGVDKLVEGYNEAKELPSGENVSMLEAYRQSKNEGLKKAGH